MANIPLEQAGYLIKGLNIVSIALRATDMFFICKQHLRPSMISPPRVVAPVDIYNPPLGMQQLVIERKIITKVISLWNQVKLLKEVDILNVLFMMHAHFYKGENSFSDLRNIKEEDRKLIHGTRPYCLLFICVCYMYIMGLKRPPPPENHAQASGRSKSPNRINTIIDLTPAEQDLLLEVIYGDNLLGNLNTMIDILKTQVHTKRPAITANVENFLYEAFPPVGVSNYETIKNFDKSTYFRDSIQPNTPVYKNIMTILQTLTSMTRLKNDTYSNYPFVELLPPIRPTPVGWDNTSEYILLFMHIALVQNWGTTSLYLHYATVAPGNTTPLEAQRILIPLVLAQLDQRLLGIVTVAGISSLLSAFSKFYDKRWSGYILPIIKIGLMLITTFIYYSMAYTMGIIQPDARIFLSSLAGAGVGGVGGVGGLLSWLKNDPPNTEKGKETNKNIIRFTLLAMAATLIVITPLEISHIRYDSTSNTSENTIQTEIQNKRRNVMPRMIDFYCNINMEVRPHKCHRLQDLKKNETIVNLLENTLSKFQCLSNNDFITGKDFADRGYITGLTTTVISYRMHCLFPTFRMNLLTFLGFYEYEDADLTEILTLLDEIEKFLNNGSQIQNYNNPGQPASRLYELLNNLKQKNPLIGRDLTHRETLFYKYVHVFSLMVIITIIGIGLSGKDIYYICKKHVTVSYNDGTEEKSLDISTAVVNWNNLKGLEPFTKKCSGTYLNPQDKQYCTMELVNSSYKKNVLDEIKERKLQRVAISRRQFEIFKSDSWYALMRLIPLLVDNFFIYWMTPTREGPNNVYFPSLGWFEEPDPKTGNQWKTPIWSYADENIFYTALGTTSMSYLAGNYVIKPVVGPVVSYVVNKYTDFGEIPTRLGSINQAAWNSIPSFITMFVAASYHYIDREIPLPDEDDTRSASADFLLGLAPIYLIIVWVKCGMGILTDTRAWNDADGGIQTARGELERLRANMRSFLKGEKIKNG
jgi:hypothetical protein